MSVSRLWLALVLVLFCVPLFVGLAGRDVEDDEAIYSFAVDRMLETGDWLEPKSNPHEDLAFLEKPPLKFWIIAAPIKLGLLPHDQFGLRFWDALFGGLAFVYVFLIGSRLIHPVCGAVAVLVLFAHEPLLFNHGLRGNNMEGPLVLAYCGGIFHFLAWARLVPSSRDSARPVTRALHALAVGLYFVLGFMTKFVAVLALPLVIAAASAVVGDYRRAMVRHRRLWAGVGGLAGALVAPWFVWAHLRYGSAFWQVIVGEHVIRRATSSLDPTHVQPWFFYPTVAYARFRDAGVAGVLLAGMAVLVVQAIRRRWPEGLLIVVWGTLPLLLISASTSKLYHYAYPFLPPLALAIGYLAALAILLGPAPFSRAVHAFDAAMARRLPGLTAALRRGTGRTALLAGCAAAGCVAAVSLTYGPIRFAVGGTEIRSAGVLRPAIVAFTCALLAGAVKHASRPWVALLVLAMLPLPAYRQSLGALVGPEGPMRAARDCIVRVQAELTGSIRPGLYVDVPDAAMTHTLYYYYRQVRPWVRPGMPAPDSAGTRDDPAEGRPALVWNEDSRDTPGAPSSPKWPRSSGAPIPRTVFDARSRVTLFLPDSYAPCVD